jgi:clan AA aspartic protease
MARESGSVNSFREAIVEIRLRDGVAIECVVDTGFDGGLLLPITIADQLRIPILGRLIFEMVGGTRMVAPVGLASIEWLGATREVESIFSEANEALIGTELLAGTSLNIDYVANVVTISKVD